MNESIDFNALTPAQQAVYKEYETLFSSQAYQAVLKHFADRIQNVHAQYQTAVGEQLLGRLQGAEHAYNEFINYQTLVEAEFLAYSQEEELEDPSEDEVVSELL